VWRENYDFRRPTSMRVCNTASGGMAFAVHSFEHTHDRLIVLLHLLAVPLPVRFAQVTVRTDFAPQPGKHQLVPSAEQVQPNRDALPRSRVCRHRGCEFS
jgi:hypothetical protein